MKPTPVKIQTSAGGVVYRLTPKGPEVALISVKGGKIWTLPKGTVDKGEKLEETALREVSEETGLKAGLEGRLGEITYWYYLVPEKARCKKTVHFYLMRCLGGSTSGHDREVDSAAWFPIGEALRATTYKGDREMLEKAWEMLKRTGEGAAAHGEDTKTAGA
ncbi:MAG: NUDIX hydrolase [Nitrospiraceae bacterium]|nr:NUDIX hydrolase [Nitrospiraceae bacterium]